MDRNYFMVRAMSSSEDDFKEIFDYSVVALGFSYVDFTKYSTETVDQLWKEVENHYDFVHKAAPQVVSRKYNEIKRFLSIKEGDYIIVPYYNAVCLAIAGKERIYKPDIADSLDLSNQLKVTYVKANREIKKIPRNNLREDLQRRLRVRGATVSDLYEFKDEIEQLFEQTNYTWESKIETEENKRIESFKKTLLEKIWKGKTNLQTGGEGLENLVKELFECEGYEAEKLPKNNQNFQGIADADIKASRSDRFTETEILVQVKHHSGHSDNWGIEQLKAIQKSKAFDDSTKLCFLTSGHISEDVINDAEIAGIMTIDGNELMNWIFDNIDKLNPETKRKLGITSIPYMID